MCLNTDRDIPVWGFWWFCVKCRFHAPDLTLCALWSEVSVCLPFLIFEKFRQFTLHYQRNRENVHFCSIKWLLKRKRLYVEIERLFKVINDYSEGESDK